MTGTQNAGNPISEGLNVNNFLGEDDPGPSTGDRLRIKSCIRPRATITPHSYRDLPHKFDVTASSRFPVQCL